jgi:flavin reductase
LDSLIADVIDPPPLASVRDGLAHEAFKDAMARLAGGVGVAACWDGEAPVGLLVSSIAVLSVEPPRVLFCVRKATRSHNALFRTRQCSLNILAESDRGEAERFSDPVRTHERFDPSRWSLEPQSPPRHRTALIGLVGSIVHRLDAGTHTVFVLGVNQADARDARPLVYFDRSYAGLHVLPDG